MIIAGLRLVVLHIFKSFSTVIYFDLYLHLTFIAVLDGRIIIYILITGILNCNNKRMVFWFNLLVKTFIVGQLKIEAFGFWLALGYKQ